MPTPEELEKLNSSYRLSYDTLVSGGMDPSEAYSKIFAEQQSEMNARQNLAQQAEMEQTVKTGGDISTLPC